jgi:antitoxin MazE
MELPIIQIGNSKGLRLSKAILDSYGIGNSVELVLEKGYLKIVPLSKPRKGWESKLKKMAEAGDDALLIDDVFEDEEPGGWK